MTITLASDSYSATLNKTFDIQYIVGKKHQKHRFRDGEYVIHDVGKEREQLIITGFQEAGTIASSNVDIDYRGYDEGGEEWATNPENMVDDSSVTYASTTSDADIQLCHINELSDYTEPFGYITNVRLSVRGYYTGSPSTHKVQLRPIFRGNTDGSDYEHDLPASVDYTAYTSIFSDGEAPTNWGWRDLVELDMDVESDLVGSGTLYIARVRFRVTYTTVNAYTQLKNLFDIMDASEEIDLTGLPDSDMNQKYYIVSCEPELRQGRMYHIYYTLTLEKSREG